jgi:hypothetical protein
MNGLLVEIVCLWNKGRSKVFRVANTIRLKIKHHIMQAVEMSSTKTSFDQQAGRLRRDGLE